MHVCGMEVLLVRLDFLSRNLCEEIHRSLCYSQWSSTGPLHLGKTYCDRKERRVWHSHQRPEVRSSL